ncbi:MAG: DNA double-strand break repair nuclease NurA [Acidobacteriia bacterium]|nr:DNA double-strand break repair nuclease NurA [Terriglobia bacterium]
MPDDPRPFADLPAGLVEEVLDQTTAVGDMLLASFRHLQDTRAARRQELVLSGMIRHESSLGYPPLPTTCATDGSYAVERLLSSDLAAAAAVAVEGLTPPSEKRHWDEPRHSTFIVAESHNADTATVLRAVMLGRELLLASRAPHDLVMLDMTFTLPIIYFNQALNQAPNSRGLRCAQEFLHCCQDYLEAYRDLLRAERSDKNYIGLPKYSTRRELGQLLDWPGEQDDRSFLTHLLEPGEFTKPVPLEKPDQAWHFNLGQLPSELRAHSEQVAKDIVASLDGLYVFHYKPHPWLPAIRVEAGFPSATNDHRLAPIIQGLKHQCATAGMLEPYPIWLADRTVKALARAMPTFRQVATQRISEQYDGDIGDVFFAMHGYRTESGG